MPTHRIFRECRIAGGVVALAASLASPAEAGQLSEVPSATRQSRTTIYQAEFFAQYSPKTALDIARRVPGFGLDLGSQDARGFAGVAGNVVINGARPSSKAETLETILLRIPAPQVTQVELGPGDIYGADYSGKSQVLNIVLSDAGGIDGNFTATARRHHTGKIAPDGSVSAMIRKGASTITLAAGTNNFIRHEDGTDTLIDDRTGQRLEFRRKFNNYRDFNPYLSGSWALENASDDAIRVNARWSPGRFDLTQRNHVSPTGGPERDDDFVQDYEIPVIEIGGDVTRPLGGGAIKLVGLATRRKRDWLDRYRFRGEGGSPVMGGYEQLQDAKRNETILRLNWTRANLAGISFETGVEGALNTLDYDVEFSEISPDGELVRIDLPLDTATVRERRGQIYVRGGKQLSPAFRLDAGLDYEFSKLKVGGDAQANRSLNFLKPNLTLDLKRGSGLHGQLSIRRTVAQLDFYDFISAAELGADRVNAGNANLMPQRAWEFRAMVENPILGDGLARIDLGRDIIDQLQDRILLCADEEPSECFDAPGNICTGKRYFAALTVDAPLDKLGLKGARLKLTGQLQRSRVEDPISGRTRNFSGYFPNWEWKVDYRQDLTAFSYGFAVGDHARTTYFRTDEFDTSWNGGPFATAFVEYRPTDRTSIVLDIDNLIDTTNLRRRLIHFPNRADPERVVEEMRTRDLHLNIGLTLKQTFGGGGNRSGSGVAQGE